ncbi:MAG: hypothetical protein MJA83_03425 [Gammaproteobacteria bacterium]|nr:hypothetical protein [Gammaproteobacteria bacterium]
MFLVRSTRAQGAFVEILHKGRKVQQRIVGMGSVISDGLTADINTHRDLGWVTVTLLKGGPEDTKEYYSDQELRSMKKKELQSLISEKNLGVDPNQRVGELKDALVLLKIPKE